MSTLFDQTRIGSLELKNRFVRSATYDALADAEGKVTENQINFYTKLANGGVGLILTGITNVIPSGKITMDHNSIHSDDYVQGLKQLTTSVHQKGAKIAVQLFHAGKDRAGLLKALNITDEKALAPSFLNNDTEYNEYYRSMTENDILKIIQAFDDAAVRAKEAGFDAVQIHGAHSYLFSQFLSPLTNQRIDNWGGSLENRLRIHHETLKDIKEKVGEDYPVLIKFGIYDGLPGGLKFSEGKKAAQYLAEFGFDAIEVSNGLRGDDYEESEFKTKIDSPEREAYFRDYCREIKSLVNIPVLMVGGLRSFELINDIIKKKDADYVSLCRPFIREPDIVNRWESGNSRKSKCISCNKCIDDIVMQGKQLCCAIIDD
jgi:2,4-dienoyl-CoA reductase-like NADH-dependent reductase (Old Yellow Enzyme family)